MRAQSLFMAISFRQRKPRRGSGATAYRIALPLLNLRTADTNGTRSTPEASAPPVSTSGLQTSTSRVPTGRRIPSGIRADKLRVIIDDLFRIKPTPTMTP